ncbi:hypothetical protein Cylst_1380 [Cylindrospermum stagnale PCC 7417]|uniref:Uncharacterized protein n=1 Tax=Cylindrospermum stagnale PCC 7417 TaxID=56107 RepID=K9WU01_9NOST|nr:hypothetical protein [Cylindrospermum stagnale]AFZ23668.1 hypothetical protein Cylst_1380 [Cylindrospermum stagnale PCC 7417]
MLETNVKITSIVIFFLVSAYMLVPKIFEVSRTFSALMANTFSATTSNNRLNIDAAKAHSEDRYIPPNYGGPDSQHGSGTR